MGGHEWPLQGLDKTPDLTRAQLWFGSECGDRLENHESAVFLIHRVLEAEPQWIMCPHSLCVYIQNVMNLQISKFMDVSIWTNVMITSYWGKNNRIKTFCPPLYSR